MPARAWIRGSFARVNYLTRPELYYLPLLFGHGFALSHALGSKGVCFMSKLQIL